MRDRREHKQLTQDAVKEMLNRLQLDALLECQYFGWRLKFIRRPLFQEPVPIIYNDTFDQIGIIDPDGRINVDMELEIRSSRPNQTQQPLQVQQEPESVSWEEKRKDMVPATDNSYELLNENQRRALRQIETFGWQLHFLRRPSFKDSEAVILSPKGDRFAILECDGRINMTADLAVRQEISVEQKESTSPMPAPKIRLAE